MIVSDSWRLKTANAVEGAQERRNCKVQVYTTVGDKYGHRDLEKIRNNAEKILTLLWSGVIKGVEMTIIKAK